jgi:hypothetical protein
MLSKFAKPLKFMVNQAKFMVNQAKFMVNQAKFMVNQAKRYELKLTISNYHVYN